MRTDLYHRLSHVIGLSQTYWAITVVPGVGAEIRLPCGDHKDHKELARDLRARGFRVRGQKDAIIYVAE